MSPRHSKIGVTITQWNYAHHTIRLLEQLIVSNCLSVIVICDNGSREDEYQLLEHYLKKRFDTAENKALTKTILIRNKHNSGFSLGMNAAINTCMELNMEWIWLLNNDVSLTQKDLQTTSSLLATSTPGIYGTTMTENGRDPFTGSYQFNRLTTRFKAIKNKRQLDQINQRNRYISGANMIVHQSVFKTVGLLNDRTFLYFEELNLLRKAFKSGFMQYHLKGPIVDHLGAGSSGSDEFSSTRAYHETWSTLDYYAHNDWPMFPIVYLFRTLAKIYSLLRSGRSELISSVLNATFDFTRRRNKDKNTPAIVSIHKFPAANSDSQYHIK